MRDVAQSSGFSPATVSIVLNNAPLARYIAPATKKRIEDVAKKLGYRPNAMADFCAASEATASASCSSILPTRSAPRSCEASKRLYQSSYVQIFAMRTPEKPLSNAYWNCCSSITLKRLIVVAELAFRDIHLLADLTKRNIPAATIGFELPGAQSAR